MFIPGQVEQWITICDLNNMSMTSLPRKQILGFGDICQNNLMYFLFRSFYTHVGWGQRLFYKAAAAFIDPETKLKIVLSGEGNPEQLVQLFHPDQLEQRFGGRRPTPTNFWPPYIGPEFIPEAEKAELHANNLIPPEAYDQILVDNPELHVHPLRLKEGRCENAHFRMEEPEPVIEGQPKAQEDR